MVEQPQAQGAAPGVATATPPAISMPPAPAVASPPSPPAAPAEPTTLLGEKPPEAKPGEKPAEAAPIKYTDFKLPDGMELEPTALAEFSKVAAEELKLPQETAQRLLDFHTAALKTTLDQASRQWTDTQKTWQDEVAADPEIGGDKLAEVKVNVAKLFDRFGDPKLREALNFTGAGNHPAVIRTFAKIAKALNEGTFVPAGRSATPPQTAAQALYPKMTGT